MSGCFITATDTDAGKTFVAAALLHALAARGLSAAPMKPVAAGTIEVNGLAVNADVALLAAVTGHRYPSHAVNPYCFAEAIAPHIAAAREHITVDLGVIQAAYRTLAARADIVVVEGAGGFLVPLSAGGTGETMAIIPAALALPVVMVVGMRLGCLNHALLTVEAIRARGLLLAGWVANTPGDTMAAYAENLATLKAAIAAPCLGEIPRIEGLPLEEAVKLASHCLLPGPLLELLFPDANPHGAIP